VSVIIEEQRVEAKFYIVDRSVSCSVVFRVSEVFSDGRRKEYKEIVQLK